MSAITDSGVGSLTRRLTPVSLDTVLGAADLQVRTDRKYVLTPELFAGLVDEVGADLGVLEIDGRRAFSYESVYFDTPNLDSYFGAAHGRRCRFKVRTRCYVDSERCALEVKTRGGRDETRKHRMQYDPAKRHKLDEAALAFVRAHVWLPEGCELAPVVTTTYRRTTVVDLAAGDRLTCDARLLCWSPAGKFVSLADHLLLETKSAGGTTTADRWLWRAGCRPLTISKYGIGMAALDPDLPANKWNRTVRRYFT